MNNYKGKKVTVVGLARSGAAAARLLVTLGARVGVTEQSDTPKVRGAAAALRTAGVRVEWGGHSRSFIEGSEVVVVSPGVRLDAPPCVWASEMGLEIISEVELAAGVCQAPMVAITGTNGKTTTTTLVGDVIKRWGRRVHLLGNIGTPFSAAVGDIQKDDFAVLEISSFQLETVKHFHPRIAVILNLTPDHLDRYDSMDEYLSAKKRIFMNQDENDWLVLNHGDARLRRLAGEARSRAVFFNQGASEGDFNENQLAVLAVATVLDIPRAVVLDVFRTFRGVEHRMEWVREIDGIEFINDSKATNIDSTVWALKNIKRPAVLIAGGRDKGSDFGSINGLVKQKVKSAVLVGEASDRIAAAWEGALPYEKAATFEEAVETARRKAAKGDIVLFSPMCKSFDMFTDYEHRGRTFKDIVNRLV